MRRYLLLTLAAALVGIPTSVGARDRQEHPTADGRGYYKDVFMDAGVMLNTRQFLYAADYLGLSLEVFAASNYKETSVTQADSVLQQLLMVGNPLDENGVLLYPDGAPRYRLLYVNGGRSWAHGPSLGDQGLERMRQFVAAGGSYVGTCAGALLSSSYIRGKTLVPKPFYTRIWPGSVRYTGIDKSRTGIVLTRRSSLLRYYDFGGDHRIDSVYHNGGVYADTEVEWPEETEVLARFDCSNLKPNHKATGQPVIWAYKTHTEMGRLVVCGSHPEIETGGERLQLMSAMMQYALDGNGVPRVKGTLPLGTERAMTASTHDDDPAHTRIGDRQYHHFTVEVPRGLDTLTVTLRRPVGWEAMDLYLFANPGEMAWMDNAAYQDIARGTDKVLTIPNPKPGTWYLSVYCATTVEQQNTDKGLLYTDHLEVLNGVPYTLGVNKPIESKK